MEVELGRLTYHFESHTRYVGIMHKLLTAGRLHLPFMIPFYHVAQIGLDNVLTTSTIPIDT